MSSKTQTSSTNQSKLQFDPQSMARYQALQSGGSNILQQYMNNPFGNAFYNMGLGQSVLGAQKGGANLMGAMQSQMKTSGLSGQAGNAFQAAQTGKIGRATQSMVGQANTSNVMNALQRQLGATNMSMMYNPLMTGEKGSSNSTETKSGLGTWLPQLLGAGLGAAGSIFGGAGGGGGASGFGFGGSNAGAASGGFGLGMPFPSQFSGFGAPASFGGGGSMAPNPFMLGGGQF